MDGKKLDVVFISSTSLYLEFTTPTSRNPNSASRKKSRVLIISHIPGHESRKSWKEVFIHFSVLEVTLPLSSPAN
jgi:hypothetical protein